MNHGPKKVFEGANHNVLMRLTNEKKTTTSNYLYFWSYDRISFCFWVLPPFMALFSVRVTFFLLCVRLGKILISRQKRWIFRKIGANERA